jgi:hypothetical protein
MAKKKQKWQAGDNFLVPLDDGTFGQGQVVVAAENAMNSAVCVFSSAHYKEKPSSLNAPNVTDAIAVIFVTRDLLDSGRWEVLTNEPNDWSADYIGFDRLKRGGFVGVKIIGSANAEHLLNAFRCLRSWNDFFDPNYLDNLLLSPKRKPSTVRLS